MDFNTIVKAGIEGTPYKMVNTSFDMSSTGTLTITGVGFKPRALVVFAVQSTATGKSYGMGQELTLLPTYISYNGAQQFAFGDAANVMRYTPDYCIHVYTDGSSVARAYVQKFTKDGVIFTLQKAGAPTGTANLQILFLG